MISKAKQEGYQVVLWFYWLQSAEQAIERVQQRVSEGGHNIPSDVIIRRYERGIVNLFRLYLPIVAIVDSAMLFDNSDGNAEMIEEKSVGTTDLTVYNQEKFNILKID